MTSAHLLTELEALRERVAELEGSQQAHRQLMEHTRDVVVVIDLGSGRCLEGNHSARAQLRCDFSADISLLDIVGEPHREAMVSALRLLQEGREETVEVRFDRVDAKGQSRPMNGVMTRLPGRELRAQLVACDTRCAQASEFLDILLETVPDFIYFKDRERRFVLASRSFELLLQRAPGEIIGKRDEDLWPQDVGSPAILDDLRVIEEGIPVLDRVEGGEVLDGVECWVSTNKMPWRGPDGEIRGLYGISKDITETRRVQLEQSEHRMRQIIDAVFGFVFLCTSDGRLLDANRASMESAALKLSDVMGIPLWETYWWSHDPDVQSRMRDVMSRVADGEVVHFEEQARVRGGEIISLDLRFAPMRADNGAVIGSVGFAVDITARKRADATIRASLREKEILLREVHHRVKNNLQIISSLLYFQSKRAVTSEQLTVFEEARQRVYAMVLVHEMLYQSDELSSVDFGAYVRALCNALLASAPGRSVEIVADSLELPIESALPCGMIVCELLTNALKYAYPDDRSGVVHIEIHCENNQVRVHVSDDGDGFPPGFEPSSVDSFGWRLITSLITQLDGEIDVSNASGAHIDLRFPLSEPGSTSLLAQM